MSETVQIKTPWLASKDPEVPSTLNYSTLSMCGRVEEMVRQYPNYIAYEFMGKTTTYAEMWQKINACAKSLTDTPCTCNGVIMSDIPDCQDITDDSVAVAVDCVNVLLDVILNHGALKLCTLIGIETYIICILIKIQGCHIKLSCSTAGGLAVKPY